MNRNRPQSRRSEVALERGWEFGTEKDRADFLVQLEAGLIEPGYVFENQYGERFYAVREEDEIVFWSSDSLTKTTVRTRNLAKAIPDVYPWALGVGERFWFQAVLLENHERLGQ